MDYIIFLREEVRVNTFHLMVSVVFLLAIIHMMLTSFFHKKAHQLELKYDRLKHSGEKDKNSQSIMASILHLLGEIEAVFGIWAIVLAALMSYYFDWYTFVAYVNMLDYTEPLFKIVMMTIAATRPIIKMFEVLLWKVVRFFGSSINAWWLVILILAPLLGSLITEPGAMTVGAMLLADKFYVLNPSRKLKYVTLALLFTNVSIGSMLTSLSGMPILMVAGTWDWNTSFMMRTFGWKAVLAILLSTACYYFIVKKDLNELREPYEHLNYKRHIQHRFISHKELEESFVELEQIVDKRMGFTSELDAYSLILKENIKALALEKLTDEEIVVHDIENAIDEKFDDIKVEQYKRTVPGLLDEKHRPTYKDPHWDEREDKVPVWVISAHVLFLIWTVVNAHEPVLFLAGFMFFLGFYQVTSFYQNKLDLKPALLVAFFLAGLMVHGTLQRWWIEPLLANLKEFHLFGASIVLSAFKDNASIAYLSTLVSDFPMELKYAVFTGALTGGGLTIIANAPNAVGASILKKFFNTGISFGQLFKYALLPTIITSMVFYFLK